MVRLFCVPRFRSMARSVLFLALVTLVNAHPLQRHHPLVVKPDISGKAKPPQRRSFQITTAWNGDSVSGRRGAAAVGAPPSLFLRGGAVATPNDFTNRSIYACVIGFPFFMVLGNLVSKYELPGHAFLSATPMVQYFFMPLLIDNLPNLCLPDEWGGIGLAIALAYLGVVHGGVVHRDYRHYSRHDRFLNTLTLVSIIAVISIVHYIRIPVTFRGGAPIMPHTYARLAEPND